ncbi:hypothetical protein ACVBR5_000917 [Burkholderia cenocepacia]
MAKQPTAPTAQTKQATGDSAGDAKDVTLNTAADGAQKQPDGADSNAPEGTVNGGTDAGSDNKQPADGAADAAASLKQGASTLDATLADVGDAADDAARAAGALAPELFKAATLAEHVSGLLAGAEKAGDTASQSVMNRIHVKIAEFRHMLTSIEQHVLDSAHADVQELVDDLKRLF